MIELKNIQFKYGDNFKLINIDLNILKNDNLTDYIKNKYKDIKLKVKNENGNIFLNKDVIYIILKELEENNQVVYENEKFNLR